MLALKIRDTKNFMNKLLAGDTFDTFLFSEGTVTTFTTFTIDGTWHGDYFSEEEIGGLTWKLMRPILFQIIKGKNTPINMRIVLKLADHNVESLLRNSDVSLQKEQVDGLYLNLSYSKGEAVLTTGTSLKIFTMDKSLDRVWDDLVRRFLAGKGIDTE